MLRNPTLVILGAGASFECGMPLGSALKTNVANACNFYIDGAVIKRGDSRLYEILRLSRRSEIAEYIQAGRALCAASADFPSTDELLHYFSANLPL